MDTRGLVDKYEVHRKDGRPLKGGGAIVLEVGDPKTWPAIAKLADSVEAAGNSLFSGELRPCSTEWARCARWIGTGKERSPRRWRPSCQRWSGDGLSLWGT